MASIYDNPLLAQYLKPQAPAVLPPALVPPQAKKNWQDKLGAFLIQGDANWNPDDATRRQMVKKGLLEAGLSMLANPSGYGNSPMIGISGGLLKGIGQMNAEADDLRGKTIGINGGAGLAEFNALTAGLTPEQKRQAALVRLGLKGRESSAAIKYMEVEGSDGRKRIVAFDPNNPQSTLMTGERPTGREYTEAELQSMSDGSGWQPPTDPAAIQANKIVQSFIDAGFTPKQAGEMADMYLAKERPNGGTATVPQQANPYVSMSPSEKAAAEAQGKADVALVMDPIIAGSSKRAELGAELDIGPQIAGAKEAATKTAAAQAEAAAKQAKAAKDAATMLPYLDEAEALLKDGATGGYGGAAVDSALAAGGYSTKGAQKTAALRILASKLVQQVPRFEGPQSNIDVQNYKEAAGDLANPLLPVKTRLAALETMRMLAEKAAKQQTQAPRAPAQTVERTYNPKTGKIE